MDNRASVASRRNRHRGGGPQEVPAPNLGIDRSAGTSAALLLEGTLPMIYDLILSVIVPALGIAALVVVYLVSGDPDHRGRAWQVLKLLLRR